MTQDNRQQPPKPSPELKRLDALVGKWVTEWRTKDCSFDPAFRIIGTDTYEWLPGELFLVHQVDVRMDSEPYRVIEIIGGYDAGSKTFPMRAFDSRGDFTTMHASISAAGVWTFAAETTRATLVISTDGSSMKADWEQSSDGLNWTPWMEMKFTRIT